MFLALTKWLAVGLTFLVATAFAAEFDWSNPGGGWTQEELDRAFACKGRFANTEVEQIDPRFFERELAHAESIDEAAGGAALAPEPLAESEFIAQGFESVPPEPVAESEADVTSDVLIQPNPGSDRPLSPAEAQEIDRLRSRIGTVVPDELGVQPAVVAEPVSDAETEPQVDLIRAARQVVRENLLFARTPGYRARELILTADPAGHLNLDVRLRVVPGTIVGTGNPLDLVARGSGFFSVTHEGAIFYTRAGHFQIGPQRTLGLRIGADFYELDPVVTVPVDAESVAVEQDGVVTSTDGGEEARILGRIGLTGFTDASRLAPAGPILFTPTEGSGAGALLPAGPRAIDSGVLEYSNSTPEDEVDLAKMLEDLARILGSRD